MTPAPDAAPAPAAKRARSDLDSPGQDPAEAR
jgi:hypothetical protein